MDDDIKRQLDEFVREMMTASTVLNQLNKTVIETSVQLRSYTGTVVRTLQDINVSLKTLNKDIKEHNKEIKEHSESVKKSTAAEKQHTESVEDMTETEDKYVKVGSMRNRVAAELLRLMKEEEELEKKKRKREDARESIQDAAIDALENLRKSLLDANSGMGTYGNVVSNLTTQVWHVAKNFGIFGKVIGGVIGIFGAWFAAAARQAQSQVEAAEKLSEIGVGTTLNIERFAEIGRNAGYTAENLKDFAERVKTIGPAISVFGNNVTQAFERVSDMYAMTPRQLAVFATYGVNQEKLNTLQSQYVQLQLQNGLLVRGSIANQRNLNKESSSYVKNLIALREISGMELEEQIRRQQQIAENEEMRIYLSKQSIDAQRLRDQADKTSDENEKKALLRESEATKNRVENSLKLRDTLVSMGYSSEQVLVALQYALTGAVTNGEVAMTLGTNMLEASRAAVQTGKGFTDAGQAGVKNLELFIGAVGEVGLAARGSGIPQALGNLSDGVAVVGANLDKNGTEMQKQINASFGRINKDVEKGVGDTTRETKVALDAAQRSFRLASDRLVQIMSGPVRTAFQYLIDGIKLAAKGLIWFVKQLTELFPSIRGKFGDFDKMMLEMSTPEELKTLVEDNKKVMSELLKPIETLSLIEQRRELHEKEVVKLEAEKERYLKQIRENMVPLTKTESERLTEINKKLLPFHAAQVELAKQEEQAFMQHPSRAGARSQVESARGMFGKKGTDVQVMREIFAEAAQKSGSAQSVLERQGQMNIPDMRQSESGISQAMEAGLRVQGGESPTGGGLLTENALKLAKQVQEAFAAGRNDGERFSMFTALNSLFHQENRPQSKHTQGKAFDFTLMGIPTKEQAAAIVKRLQELGAAKVIDEYYWPTGSAPQGQKHMERDGGGRNANTTGPHFHVETARDGGIFSKFGPAGIVSGSREGYRSPFASNMIMHGTEMVLPLRKNSLLFAWSQTSEDDAKEEFADFISEMMIKKVQDQAIRDKQKIMPETQQQPQFFSAVDQIMKKAQDQFTRDRQKMMLESQKQPQIATVVDQMMEKSRNQFRSSNVLTSENPQPPTMSATLEIAKTVASTAVQEAVTSIKPMTTSETTAPPPIEAIQSLGETFYRGMTEMVSELRAVREIQQQIAYNTA